MADVTADNFVLNAQGAVISGSLQALGTSYRQCLVWLTTNDDGEGGTGHPACSITLENTSTTNRFGEIAWARVISTAPYHVDTFAFAVDPDRNNTENFKLRHFGQDIFEVTEDNTQFRFWTNPTLQAWNGVQLKATNLANTQVAGALWVSGSDVLTIGATTTWSGGVGIYPGSNNVMMVLPSGTVLVNAAADDLTNSLIVNGTAKATAFNTNSTTASVLQTSGTSTTFGTNIPLSIRSSAVGKSATIQFWDQSRDAYISLVSDRLSFGGTTEALGIKLATGNIIIGKTSDDGTNKLQVSGGATIGNVTSATSCAILEVKSNSKGVLFPRMTTTQKNAISSPVAGLQVFDTTLAKMSYYNGTIWVNF